MTGKPAIVLTENSESLRSSLTVKSLPLIPSTAKTSAPEVEPVTCNLAVGVI